MLICHMDMLMLVIKSLWSNNTCNKGFSFISCLPDRTLESTILYFFISLNGLERANVVKAAIIRLDTNNVVVPSIISEFDYFGKFGSFFIFNETI